MLPLETALSFFGIAVLLSLSPGPDNVFVMTLSALRGVRAGLWVVLGLCSGLIVHTLAVAFGVAALLAASSTAFTVLKLLGAAYLLYLAWGAWNAPAMTADSPVPPPMTPLQAWMRGVLMNLSNPKVVLFFLAFLPQFADPKHGSVALQTVWLGLLFILAAWLTFSALAMLAGSAGQRLRESARAQRWLNRGASLVFAGMAIKLLLSQR
ncbi:LysE family translocator [Brachymonas sp. G13]|uniref:LysE family translocator n=1 Tax=Brachymonas TaxID=28219 RepID=UPI0016B61823|nr:LysE family translocator [Brachymonas sp. J145]MEE1653098.1 LysE family translocator [Brachymonas sp. J145]NLX16605.1 LysE family translocator [Ramlibacter sp.]